jgi:hypothetical protein
VAAAETILQATQQQELERLVKVLLVATECLLVDRAVAAAVRRHLEQQHLV